MMRNKDLIAGIKHTDQTASSNEIPNHLIFLCIPTAAKHKENQLLCVVNALKTARSNLFSCCPAYPWKVIFQNAAGVLYQTHIYQTRYHMPSFSISEHRKPFQSY